MVVIIYCVTVTNIIFVNDQHLAKCHNVQFKNKQNIY